MMIHCIATHLLKSQSIYGEQPYTQSEFHFLTTFSEISVFLSHLAKLLPQMTPFIYLFLNRIHSKNKKWKSHLCFYIRDRVVLGRAHHPKNLTQLYAERQSRRTWAGPPQFKGIQLNTHQFWQKKIGYIQYVFCRYISEKEFQAKSQLYSRIRPFSPPFSTHVLVL